MKNKNLIITPEILRGIKTSWSAGDFNFAIQEFRRNAPAVPIPRLYEAYRWLKEQINIDDKESGRQFTLFIEHFLRILEERGAGDSGIYTEVLRDSAEYKYLSGLLHKNETENKIKLIEISENKTPEEQVIKKTSLKDILLKKNMPLLDIDINSWYKLIQEHLEIYNTEESFVKNCSSVITNINKRTEKNSYHVEIIVVYAYDRLLIYQTLNLKTKDFAMKLLNLMTNKGETWNRLHREYREIIRK